MIPILSGLFIKGDNGWVVLAHKTISVPLSISTDFQVKDSSIQRMHQCHIFYIKDKVAKFDLAKNRLRSTKVIILTNYNWQQSPMIHTKFR